MFNLRTAATSLSLIILCVVAAACAAAPAAPAPQPAAQAPAAEPTVAMAAAPSAVDRWDAIRQSGELKVGVSAGVSPYAFYGPDLTLDGFDVALAREIARRLALEPVIRDLAPNALPSALQSGEIDLAIGPLDATAGTQAPGPTLGPYYVARDAVLTRPGVAPVNSLAELKDLRLGVLKGSDYASWASGQLDAGQWMPYASAAEAADALGRGEVDALIMDYRPALRLAQERGLLVAGEGLAPHQEVVTVAAGSDDLRAAVEDALAAAVAEGAVARMATRFFGLAPQDILPLPLAAATLTPRPPGYFSADRSRVLPGDCAVVAWHVENVNAVFFSEAGEKWEKHPATGQETRQVCPPRTTAYELHIIHYDGREEARSVTVAVSNTPGPPAAISFEVQPAQVELGSCVELQWEAPEDADRVRITRDGEMLWDDAFPSGALSDCPPSRGVHHYVLEVESAGSATSVERLVEVQ
jgi:polar amino acid transport system substrate-binding protein